MGRVLNKLNRPIFGTVVIPPDARVDPQNFPEDEYPLHCPHCDYLLRGLSEDRCPECGETHDRGRLLVEQYVLRRTATRTPERRALLILAVLSILIVASRPMADHFVLTRFWSTKSPSHLADIYFVVMQLVLGALIAAFTVTTIWTLRQWRGKTRQRDAILRHLGPPQRQDRPG